MSLSGRVITVFGGTGFIGTMLVVALARRGARIRLPVRDLQKGKDARVLGDPGQIAPLLCDTSNEESVRSLIKGSDFVVNLMGILSQNRKNTFQKVHVDSASLIARLSAENQIEHVVHMSALGADEHSPALYGQTKAAGENAMRAAFPGVSILRPSIVFGFEDNFLVRFAKMARDFPLLVYFHKGKHIPAFEPVYADDVVRAIVHLLENPALRGQTYELGGGQVFNMKELMEIIIRAMNQNVRLVGLSMATGKTLGALLQRLPNAPLTLDQMCMLEKDAVTTGKMPGLAELGIMPQALELLVKDILSGYRPIAREVILRNCETP